VEVVVDSAAVVVVVAAVVAAADPAAVEAAGDGASLRRQKLIKGTRAVPFLFCADLVVWGSRQDTSRRVLIR
jgi:hypothetical protein